jgi:NADP-dependent 3-hydroxy acid dehydrogenase YdfG
MTYSTDLSGRVAFNSVASSGLGAQFAKALASAGADVVLISRRVDLLKVLRSFMEGAGSGAHVIELDATDSDAIKSAVAGMASM